MLNVALCMRIWREVRNFAWHRWFSLQRCCKTFCFYEPALCRMCVFVLWTSCLRAKIHYYYMWPFAKKLYHGWISTMTSSNEISWKLPPPPKWRAGCAPEPDHCRGTDFRLVWNFSGMRLRLDCMNWWQKWRWHLCRMAHVWFVCVQPSNLVYNLMHFIEIGLPLALRWQKRYFRWLWSSSNSMSKYDEIHKRTALREICLGKTQHLYAKRMEGAIRSKGG